MYRLCFIIALCILWAPFAAAQDDSVRRFVEALDQGAEGDIFNLLPSAIDAGAAAVPHLKTILSSDDKEKAERAAALLGFIGGDAAIIALQEARMPESKIFHWALCSAVASRGNRDDVLFLIKALRPDQSHDWWESRLTAAFSLGVLRAKDAVPYLRRAATEAKGNELLGGVAEDVIAWIQSEPVLPLIGEVRQPERDIYSAIFINGIYGVRNVVKLFDRNQNGFWAFHQNQWALRRMDRARSEYPSISFNIHLSPDESRALVIIDLLIKPNQGYKYNYVLQKTGSGWRVWNISLRGGY